MPTIIPFMPRSTLAGLIACERAALKAAAIASLLQRLSLRI
jgi:hypothetical protein